MNYLRAETAAQNRARARKDILGLLKQYKTLQRKKGKNSQSLGERRGIFSRNLSFKIQIDRKNKTPIKKTDIFRNTLTNRLNRVNRNLCAKIREQSTVVDQNANNDEQTINESIPTTNHRTEMIGNASERSFSSEIEHDTPVQDESLSSFTINPSNSMYHNETNNVPVDFDILNRENRTSNEHVTQNDDFNDKQAFTQAPLTTLTFDSAIAPHLQNDEQHSFGASNVSSSIDFSSIENHTGSFDITTPMANQSFEMENSEFWNDPLININFDGLLKTNSNPNTPRNGIEFRTVDMNANTFRDEDTLINFNQSTSSDDDMEITDLDSDSNLFTIEMMIERVSLGAKRAYERLFPQKENDLPDTKANDLPDTKANDLPGTSDTGKFDDFYDKSNLDSQSTPWTSNSQE